MRADLLVKLVRHHLSTCGEGKLNNLINNRMRDAVEIIIREDQDCFRQERGYSDQIFVLRTIIEEYEGWNQSLVLILVDFKRAFDSVDHQSMWKIQEDNGIPDKIIRILSLLYESSWSCVLVGLKYTACFGVDSGVIHGDSLSPTLFDTVPDYVMTRLSTVGGGIDWIGGKRLKDLDYSDDMCLFAK